MKKEKQDINALVDEIVDTIRETNVRLRYLMMKLLKHFLLDPVSMTVFLLI